jgi:DNA-binding XRE family transcriptional regulator/quercetin dioxygenase-like cupin family protein
MKSTATAELNGSQIGARLKEIRRALDRTLAQVSEATGVSISNLSKIENNQISPSFDIMKRLCDGLGVSIEDFMHPGAKSVVSGRKTTTRRDEGDHFTSGQYDYRAHASEISRKAMVPLEIRVRARKVDEFDHWSQHRGEEFVYVLSGAIEIHTEHYAPFRLERGESGYFDSSMRHVYISVSKEDARVLSVSHDPGSPEHIAQFMNPSARQVDK